ncbi:hypothetical protein LOTGIDRAFT_162596 [Lottia gigantea]|uniref:C2H2-type domain-containing protein n=1 Tax=Lottia gigantea TaxID=225164 RepID=V4AC38_LOTGI|nr:hypothetical protein LOTGIDRAFT_162596 [Lottia gigantea]ESO92670.1 hypothetical protein LOTGIDRAFT_162596 [Lottia gigantea]
MKVAVGINYIGCAGCCGLFMSRDGFKLHIEFCDGDPLKSHCEAFACARSRYLEFIAKESLYRLKENSLNDSVEAEKIISPRKCKGKKIKELKRQNKSEHASEVSFTDNLKPMEIKYFNPTDPEHSLILSNTSHDFEEQPNFDCLKHEDGSEPFREEQQNFESFQDVHGHGKGTDPTLNTDMQLEISNGHQEDHDGRLPKEDSSLDTKIIKDIDMNVVICSNTIIPSTVDNSKGLLSTTSDPSLSSCIGGGLLSDQQLSPGGWTPSMSTPSVWNPVITGNAATGWAPSMSSASGWHPTASATNSWTTNSNQSLISKDPLHDTNSVPSHCVPETILNQELSVPSSEIRAQSVEREHKSNQELQTQPEAGASNEDVLEDVSSIVPKPYKENCEVESDAIARNDNGSVIRGYYDEKCETADCHRGSINFTTSGDISKLISQLEHSINTSVSGETTTDLVSVCKTLTTPSVTGEMVTNLDFAKGADSQSSEDELVIDEGPKIIRYRNRIRKSHRKRPLHGMEIQLVEVMKEMPKSNYEAYFDFCGKRDPLVGSDLNDSKVNHQVVGKSGLSEHQPSTEDAFNVPEELCEMLEEDDANSMGNSNETEIRKNKLAYFKVFRYEGKSLYVGIKRETRESFSNNSFCGDNTFSERTVEDASPIDSNSTIGQSLVENNLDPVVDKRPNPISQLDHEVQTNFSEDEDSCGSMEDLEAMDIPHLIEKLAPIPRFKTSKSQGYTSTRFNSKASTQKYIQQIIKRSAEDSTNSKYCEAVMNGVPVLKRVPKADETDHNAAKRTKFVEMPNKNMDIDPTIAKGSTEDNDDASELETSKFISGQATQSKTKSNPTKGLKQRAEIKKKSDLQQITSKPRRSSRCIKMPEKLIVENKPEERKTVPTCDDSGEEYVTGQGEDSDGESIQVSFKTKDTKVVLPMPTEDQYTKEQCGSQTVYICNLCKQKLLSLVKLRNHLALTHNNGQEFTCKDCDFTTLYRRRYKAHVKRHTGDKSICPYCPTFYKDNSSLTRHINIKHFEQSNFRCCQCEHIAIDNQHLADHMRTHSGELLVCRYSGCEYKTWSYRNYCQHEQRHEPQFLCGQCGYSTSNKQTFTKHIATHSNLCSYQCSLCSFQARTKQIVVDHAVRDHNHMVTYSCDREQCSYTTQYQDFITSHIYNHLGVFPYKCSLCSYKGVSSAEVYEHSSIEHPNHTITFVKLLPEVQKVNPVDYIVPQKTLLDSGRFEVLEIEPQTNDCIRRDKRSKVKKDRSDKKKGKKKTMFDSDVITIDIPGDNADQVWKH